MRNAILCLTAIVTMGLALMATATGAQAVQCGGLHRLFITDLDMIPDPAMQGQPLQRWIVKLQADGSGECATQIIVRDNNELAGVGVAYTLRPGPNVIPVPVRPGYRMQSADHCYRVYVNIAATPTAVDSVRPFCAHLTPARWSLR